MFIIEELYKKISNACMFLRTTSNLIVSRNLGPIIHITPDELDFNNPEFYEVIYSTSQDIDKPL